MVGSAFYFLEKVFFWDTLMDVFIVCSAVKLMYNFHRNKLGAIKQLKGLSWELINYRRV